MAEELDKSRIRRVWGVATAVAVVTLYFYVFVYGAPEMWAWLAERGIYPPWEYAKEGRKVTW
jgi:hypothetical protein